MTCALYTRLAGLLTIKHSIWLNIVARHFCSHLIKSPSGSMSRLIFDRNTEQFLRLLFACWRPCWLRYTRCERYRKLKSVHSILKKHLDLYTPNTLFLFRISSIQYKVKLKLFLSLYKGCVILKRDS